MSILDELRSNLEHAIFQDGVTAGTNTIITMLRLLPVEKWPQALDVIERDLADGTAFKRAIEITKSDSVIDAEVIE
jgi:hypothetical protein